MKSSWEDKGRIAELIRTAREVNEQELRGRDGSVTFFDKPLPGVSAEDIRRADALLVDLTNTPHAFVLGCVMDRQIQAERAWMIPCRVFDAFTGAGLIMNNSIDELVKVPLERYREVFRQQSLHRYDYMPDHFYEAVLRIKRLYHSDASEIWRGKPSSQEVVDRFDDFGGVGQKISNMAANILVRDFGVEFSEYSRVDIALDVHVIRIMKRLGLVALDRDMESFRQNILAATRAWNPSYPGIFDKLCWLVGRTWCHEDTQPACSPCRLRGVCAVGRDALKSSNDSIMEKFL